MMVWRCFLCILRHNAIGFQPCFVEFLLLNSSGPINPQTRIKNIFAKCKFPQFFLLCALQLHTMKTLEVKRTAKKNKWRTIERERGGRKMGRKSEQKNKSLAKSNFLESHFSYFIFSLGFSFCLVHHSHIHSIMH